MSTSSARPPTPSPSAWAPCAPTLPGSTRATSRLSGSRAASPSAAGLFRKGRSSSSAAGPWRRSWRSSRQRAVQSLLLEGGPTFATSFLRGGLVDKLLLFVAPTLAGSGPRWIDELEAPLSVAGLEAEPIGGDVLLTGYIHEP